MKISLFFLSLGYLILFFGCTYDKEQNLYPDQFNACDTTQVRYSVEVSLIVQQNCMPCHNSSTASGGVTLETYDQMKTMTLNGRVQASIKHNGGVPMPQNAPKLSACKIRTIDIWFNLGCPNN